MDEGCCAEFVRQDATCRGDWQQPVQDLLQHWTCRWWTSAQTWKYLPVQLKGDHSVITLVIGHYDQFLLSSEITEGMQHSIIKINRNTNEVANRQQFLALAISLAKQMCIILNVHEHEHDLGAETTCVVGLEPYWKGRNAKPVPHVAHVWQRCYRNVCMCSWCRHLEAGPALCSEVIALLGQRSGSGPLSSPCCFAVVRVVIVFSRLRVHFFQCFSFFSPLCSCVGQALLGRIKIVSITASFLMKNVLRQVLTSQSN